MNGLKTSTWFQRVFYGFVFIFGYFIQPGWFFTNVYSYELWRDKAWVINRFFVYSLFSGLVACVFVWLCARFAKRFL
jgi:hypothetical protein